MHTDVRAHLCNRTRSDTSMLCERDAPRSAGVAHIAKQTQRLNQCETLMDS
jgi:hypothetical protein